VPSVRNIYLEVPIVSVVCIVRRVAIISPMGVVSIDCRQPMTVIITLPVFKLGRYAIVYVGCICHVSLNIHIKVKKGLDSSRQVKNFKKTTKRWSL